MARDEEDDLLGFVGWFTQPQRPVEGLAKIAGAMLGYEVRVQNFVGEWLEISEADQLRLVSRAHQTMLGRAAVIGRRSWQVGHRIRVHVLGVALDALMLLLPTASESPSRRAARLIRRYLGTSVSWEFEFGLRMSDARLLSTKLGLGRNMQLGWTTWLGGGSGGAVSTRIASEQYLAIRHVVAGG